MNIAFEYHRADRIRYLGKSTNYQVFIGSVLVLEVLGNQITYRLW